MPEDERLADLHTSGILEQAHEGTYEDLIQVAAQICDRPMAAITLVDADRWVKAAVEDDVREMVAARSRRLEEAGTRASDEQARASIGEARETASRLGEVLDRLHEYVERAPRRAGPRSSGWSRCSRTSRRT
jgi:hypothetical protein